MGDIGKKQGKGEVVRSALSLINPQDSVIVKGIDAQPIDGIRWKRDYPPLLQDVNRLKNLPVHLDASISQWYASCQSPVHYIREIGTALDHIAQSLIGLANSLDKADNSSQLLFTSSLLSAEGEFVENSPSTQR